MSPLNYTNDSVQDINRVTHDIDPNEVNTGWTQQNSNPNTKHKNPDMP